MTRCTLPFPLVLVRHLGALLIAGLTLAVAAPVVAAPGPGAGPGMPDPRQMSGIPRPDPQIPAGEVTVRVLRGGFDEPALDAVVELELRSADGRVAALHTVTAGNQGRAHFRELAPFVGGQAVARVMLDGEAIRSQQIDLRPDAGTAVMLVKGAEKGSSPTQEISLPGIVFGFEKTPPGSLMVGVFDLASRQGLAGLPVHVDITDPDGQVTTRTVDSGEMGQATFEGLADVAPGSTLQVRAQLEPEGEPYRSMSFTLDPTQGQAVVLAKGRMSPAGGNPHQGGAQAQGGAPGAPAKIPGPRIARELPPGTVQVMVVDGRDAPVADHPVTVIKKDFSGTEERFELRTNADGVLEQRDLPVVEDALYYVGVVYDGAPYTSAFFGLDERGGVRVAMRVWEVTSDPSVAQSAVQWEIVEAENDHAQVVQVYEVLVTGDKAYWPKEPLHITGPAHEPHWLRAWLSAPDEDDPPPSNIKSLVVLRGAEQWLDHDDEAAPFATLNHPIPPGEVAALSVGYVMEHDGEIAIDWTPPFEVIESALVVKESVEIEAPGATRSDRELPPQPGLDYTRAAYDLGHKGRGAVRVVVKGLLRTESSFRTLGIVIGVTMGLVLLLGVALRPKGDTRSRLQRRRDELLTALEQRRSPRERQRIVSALDRIYRQLDALDALELKKAASSRPASGAPTPGPKAS